MRVPGFDRCLAHLGAVECAAYLATLNPGTDIDHRGTTFDDDLLWSLLLEFDDALGRRVEAGSAFQPITVAAYHASGGNPGARFEARNNLTIKRAGQTGTFPNDDGRDHHNLDLRGALRLAAGSALAQAATNSGIGAIEVTAGRLGIPAGDLRLDHSLDLLLGLATPTPVQMAAAQAAFAADGQYAAPYTVAWIARGTSITYTVKPVRRPAMPPATAVAVADLLGIPIIGLRPTGTTPTGAGERAGRAEDRTAWHITIDPQLSMAVAQFADRPPAPDRSTQASLAGLTTPEAAAAISAEVWAAVPRPT
ncbi:hypothetical protein [Embleya sp. NPDC001921]